MRSDLNLDIGIQMACQSELVTSQVAGQSDNKHLGEIHQKKGKLTLQEDQFKMCMTRIPRMLSWFSHVPDVIVYTKKMKCFWSEERNVLNAIKQAILPWFEGL